MLKFPTLGAAVAIAALAAAPAHAQVKIRLGAETQVLDHVNSPSSTTWLTDQWRPSVVGMLGFYVLPVLSIDAEVAEAFRVNPPAGQDSRIGTTFRLGATFEPPLLPSSAPASTCLSARSGRGRRFARMSSRDCATS